MHLAVLISGGLDSAILLGDALRRGEWVRPIYVRCGLAWEREEFTALTRYLAALACPRLAPLIVLEQPSGDLYGEHWSVTGRAVPDAQSPDDAMFLPGRNVLLLAKALLWCHLHGVTTVALGSLQSNPFPDATAEFFQDFARVVGRAVADGRLSVTAPFAGLTKRAVMQLGRGMPLEHTWSCIQPIEGKHCGACNKCAERRRAFADAALPDPTPYQHRA
ncbi:MAG: 7-cyano-7-deazaguanine synthase [Gemmataceae bacterium]|nr:7-cyano-7-deazaguanine synthase [Gemmataceae bacterium]